MKKVFQLFIYNLFLIFTFAIIYYMIGNENFENLQEDKQINALDYLFLATTIQAGVGLSHLNMITTLSKMLAILQQLLMLGNTIFMVYLFSL